MRLSTRCARWGALGFAAIALALGCSQSSAVPVEGVVTLDGKPLSGATVSFVPVSGGRAASGRTEPDGSFHLTTFRTDDGALPGEYKVVITVTQPNEMLSKPFQEWSDQEKKAARMSMTPKGKRQAAEKKRKTPAAVPVVYTDVQQTPLKETVPPPGKVMIDLKSGQR